MDYHDLRRWPRSLIKECLMDQIDTSLSENNMIFPQVIDDSITQSDALIGKKLTFAAFQQLSGEMAGYSFVKIVVDKTEDTIHFINQSKYPFHADYIAEKILGKDKEEVRADIDRFNNSVYLDPERRFFLGILALHKRVDKQFFTLETVEIDNMNAEMLLYFVDYVKANITRSHPLYFKPANHIQESIVVAIDKKRLRRLFNYELFASNSYVPLNSGTTQGRLRVFESLDDYKENQDSLEWFDIIVMNKVPDNIPRISGIINSKHTTPLSHTNVLACGWQIPNATQIRIIDQIKDERLQNKWVEYKVDTNASKIMLKEIKKPDGQLAEPHWKIQQVKIGEPETLRIPIVNLKKLQAADRFSYGTKSANIGELQHILKYGSDRLTGFYRLPRYPRKNLIHHLARMLNVPEGSDLNQTASDFIKNTVNIPRGIAIPFAIQQEFLESSPQIQQTIGKLKMALELKAEEIPSLCIRLQQLIIKTKFPFELENYIEAIVNKHLKGASSLVVRSSSNAEDLENFSAAGIYESKNHVTTPHKLYKSIKQVWASLVSPRSVRLRAEVGISLDESYMGVIVQEEISSGLGGVLVTTNPMNTSTDFRNVFVNASTKSVNDVVEGNELPYQFLFNTVEGGGRTLSLGSANNDLDPSKKQIIAKLALVGRLLQSHFSSEYTPVDIEWAISGDDLYLLQLRPYVH